jgi:hypothetical protein
MLGVAFGELFLLEVYGMESGLHVSVARCQKLGLVCDNIPLDSMSSVLSALSCFPMYMVANVDGWGNSGNRRVRAFDILSVEQIRESFVIGLQEGGMSMDKQHRSLLGQLVSGGRPFDVIVYEYAIETLRLLLPDLVGDVPNQVRYFIAKSVVAVAKASGEGILGIGEKVCPSERDAIRYIDDTLALCASSEAKEILAPVLNV